MRDQRAHLVDRARDFLVTSGGKTVSPSFIENTLRASPYLAEAIVFGGSDAPADRLDFVHATGAYAGGSLGGVNTIDLQAAASHGVRVANMPGTNSRAVCEATLALMLAVLRRLADR